MGDIPYLHGVSCDGAARIRTVVIIFVTMLETEILPTAVTCHTHYLFHFAALLTTFIRVHLYDIPTLRWDWNHVGLAIFTWKWTYLPSLSCWIRLTICIHVHSDFHISSLSGFQGNRFVAQRTHRHLIVLPVRLRTAVSWILDMVTAT